LDLYPFCPGDRTQTTCHGRAFMLIGLLRLWTCGMVWKH
jgi:hypothetical protein